MDLIYIIIYYLIIIAITQVFRNLRNMYWSSGLIWDLTCSLMFNHV